MNDRDRAILWARDVLKQDFIVLDTETTGLRPEDGDEAVSIGIVSKEGEVLLDTLLCHKKRSHPAALRTHGHTWLETREAPSWSDVIDQVGEIVGDKPVISYCVGNYDAKIIVSTCETHETEVLDLRDRTIQALGPFAEFYGDWNDWHHNYRWQKLTTAAAHFGIDTAGAHGAAADALMTLRVVEAMAASRLSDEEG